MTSPLKRPVQVAAQAITGLFSLREMGRRSGRVLRILSYHRVLSEPDLLSPGTPCKEEFRRQMEVLRNHYTPLPFSEAIRLCSEGLLPARAVTVTFDDGYADNYLNALPVLEELEIPAIVFVASGFLDGGLMWNDAVIEVVRRCDGVLDLSESGLGVFPLYDSASRLRAIDSILSNLKYWRFSERASFIEDLMSEFQGLPSDLMLTTEQLRSLQNSGIEIGAHTRSHPILARLPSSQANSEIAGGKADLESILGEDVKFFAYPNGKPSTDYNQSHVDFLKECGFQASVTTTRGVADSNSDPFQLPRFTPWSKSYIGFHLRLLMAEKYAEQ